jgi:hypothetical protein
VRREKRGGTAGEPILASPSPAAQDDLVVRTATAVLLVAFFGFLVVTLVYVKDLFRRV